MGMRVNRMGNARPIGVGLRHGRGRPDRERSVGYGKRCDSQNVAQIFFRSHECGDFVVPGAPDFCQIRVTEA